MRAYQILRDIRHCLLGSFCHSGAIAIAIPIAGGCLKIAKLDLSPGNPPQLVQLNALPQVVLQLLHKMLSHKACMSILWDIGHSFLRGICHIAPLPLLVIA